ncbi:MAG TPA: hypothetical protein DEF35_05655 [Paenibacillus sp.]|jgi:hypothetical protein|nr:hypothetical protein [Paenibacillus sp.]
MKMKAVTFQGAKDIQVKEGSKEAYRIFHDHEDECTKVILKP